MSVKTAQRVNALINAAAAAADIADDSWWDDWALFWIIPLPACSEKENVEMSFIPLPGIFFVNRSKAFIESVVPVFDIEIVHIQQTKEMLKSSCKEGIGIENFRSFKFDI